MNILILTADITNGDQLKGLLIQHHYRVTIVVSGVEVWERLTHALDDVLVVHQEHGIAPNLCHQVRQRGIPIPILWILPSSSRQELVPVLDAGADDALVEPWNEAELLARLRALMRRGGNERPLPLSWGPLVLDPVRHQLTVIGTPLGLTPKEYGVLELLLHHPHRVLTPTLIGEQVWNGDPCPGEETIRTHIKGIRHKLKETGCPDPIETIYGVGYRLAPRPVDTTSEH